MKALAPRLPLALAVLVVASCATLDLVEVWRDPKYARAPISRILVIAVLPSEAMRAASERALAKAFADRGFAASTGSAVFPPGPLDRERALAYVRREDVDLVVVQRLAKETRRDYVPPKFLYVPPAPYFGGWYGYYGYAYGAAYSPGYYTDSTPVLAETNVYATRASPETLVWSGSSRTFDFRSAGEAAASVAALVADDLVRAGILVH